MQTQTLSQLLRMYMKLFDQSNNEIYLAPYNNITRLLAPAFTNFKGFIDSTQHGENIVNPDSAPENAIVFIYSPNYWDDISQKLHQQDCYVITESNGDLLLTKPKDFLGYTDQNICAKAMYNNTAIQRIFWTNSYKSFIQKSTTDYTQYGYAWGDPESSNDPLGNYLKIKNLVEESIKQDSIVLELGTLNGKWTRYLLNAQKVICVDINNEFIEWISNRYQNDLEKIEFYVTNGDELTGVQSNSVDLIFSIDTLVRVDKQSIYNYIAEIHRVLTPSGKAILHLPNSDIEDCRQRGFTNLNTFEITNISEKYFKNIFLDSKTLVHGTILILNK